MDSRHGCSLAMRLGLLLALLRGAALGFAPGDPAPGLRVDTLDGTFEWPPGGAAGAGDAGGRGRAGSMEQAPLLVMAYDSRDAFSRWMWRSDDSVSNFLAKSPPETEYLFLSYSEDAKQEVTAMRARLAAALATNASGPADAAEARLAHMHFATQPVGAMRSWLPQLLAEWRSPRRVIVANGTGGWALEAERLDPGYGWLPWPADGDAAPLAVVAEPCAAPESASSLAGHMALVLQGPATARGGAAACSHAQMILHAQDAGAVAVLLGAPAGGDVMEMRCAGDDCGLPLVTPATMIPHKAATALQVAVHAAQDAGANVTVTFDTRRERGYFAGIDGAGKLVEVGWEKFPTLLHLAWAAQWEEYLARLRANLSRPALVVPIFDEQVMQGQDGVRASVTLPPREALEGYDRLELDLALGCPGKDDASCPIWDHVVQLFACCQPAAAPAREAAGGPLPGAADVSAHNGDGMNTAGGMFGWGSGAPPPCDPCQPTPWLASPPSNGSAEGGNSAANSDAWTRWAGQQTAAGAGLGVASADLCGRELGRWITPFRRRVGRWLTDVTPYAPLLAGGQCRFTLQTVPWALPWVPSLNLRFSRSAERAASASDEPEPEAELSSSSSSSSSSSLPAAAAAASARSLPVALRQAGAQQPGGAGGLRPALVLQLFQGGTFDSGYNARHAPIKAATPPGTVRALLSAVITGHGSDDNQCAEFCPTSHHFIVNGAEHWVNYTEAGTEWGCANKVAEGVEPNEHGTWQYGRNGWCDGQEVRPWLADITADLHPPGGEENVVSYHGWFRGSDPRPEFKPGFILMQSNVVFYTAAAAADA